MNNQTLLHPMCTPLEFTLKSMQRNQKQISANHWTAQWDSSIQLRSVHSDWHPQDLFLHHKWILSPRLLPPQWNTPMVVPYLYICVMRLKLIAACFHIFFFSEPELKDLALLDIRDWRNLGLQLSLPDGELQHIRRNNPGDEKSCITDMFSLWLRMASPRATYEQLVEALLRMGENSTVEHICQCHGMCWVVFNGTFIYYDTICCNLLQVYKDHTDDQGCVLAFKHDSEGRTRSYIYSIICLCSFIQLKDFLCCSVYISHNFWALSVKVYFSFALQGYTVSKVPVLWHVKVAYLTAQAIIPTMSFILLMFPFLFWEFIIEVWYLSSAA